MIKDIKYNGYTATPSDYECLDGELAGSYNLVPEDGAMHPVLPPQLQYNLPVVVAPATGEYKVLFIHHATQNYKHYIVLGPDNKLYYFNEASSFPADVVVPDNYAAVPADTAATSSTIAKVYLHKISDTVFTTHDINAIGNTLIVNGNDGITYFLWSTSGATPQYEDLGQKPPMLEIEFGLKSDFAVYPETENTSGQIPGFKGLEINVGKIRDTLLPKLGTEDGYDSAGWVDPQPVMATHSGSSEVDARVREFASEYATYSVEDKTNLADDDYNDWSIIKNRLSNGVFAAINKLINEKGTMKNKFVMPFFVRYAYRMYDDSYIMHSYPVLMIPNSRGPIFGLDGHNGMLLADYVDSKVGFKMRGRAYAFLSQLTYRIKTLPSDLDKWKDIITSVDIGVSAPIYTFKQDGTVYGWTNMDGANAWDEYYSISELDKAAGTTVSSNRWATNGVKSYKVAFEQMLDINNTTSGGFTFNKYFNVYSSDYKYPSYIATVPQRNISDINKDLTAAANFYIIKKLTIEEIAATNTTVVELEEGTLNGLVARQCISDDFRSHDVLKASLMTGFNGRMNYAGIERIPHAPLKPAVQFTQASASDPSNSVWGITVTLKNDLDTCVVSSSTSGNLTTNAVDFPRWLFYPDTNAKFAYVSKTDNGTTTTYKLKLTPHDFLNGAYWLADIMTPNLGQSMTGTATAPSVTTGGFKEVNKIYTSNVNNPFAFSPTGINTVGTGTILDIRAAVKALSQGQFGQFPLYAFTTEGVWALETSSTGSYIARQPITRDVVIKDSNGNYNVDSITQLDDAVIYATDRGIMMLSGSNNICITDAINSESPFAFSDLFTTEAAITQWETFLTNAGYTAANGFNTGWSTQVPFSQFLIGSRMLYDYTHQRIIAYNTGHNYAYIYSLKDHSWGMMATDIDYGINSYPDALAVTDAHKIVNLCANAPDVTTVKGLLATRPIKLDQPDALKTIDTIIQRGKFDFLKSGRTPKPIRTILYGSRDLYNWFMISSSTDHNLRGFRGTPYKYFRIVLLCDFAPDESVYGATIQYNPRYINRLR